ncbi:MAG TPA: CDP-alcohol phosphatidyltransferase family protein [Bacteroidota bacterium]|nr:CDP-alcohol phosphatidyltransferase family protein [Bacteroidota bacterium]
MSRIASTYKSRDVEETIDVFFYRPLGYLVARACAPVGLTPNAVTIVSIVIGVAAGHLFYYRDFASNAWGIVLWVVADILDSADGQLARITGRKSKLGRILDGLGSNIIFLSIYLHLMARMAATHPEVHWAWFLVLVVAGGVSHSLQSSLADYYRNAYMKFVVDHSKSELEGSDGVRREYESVTFSGQPLEKLLMRMYLNYTIQQESLSRNFQALRKKAASEFGANIPGWFSEEYRRANLPLMKYYAILTTNTRVIILAACVLLDAPWVYFSAEVVGINAVMVLLTAHQEKLSARLTREIDSRKVPA